jgi:hypothetical protein
MYQHLNSDYQETIMRRWAPVLDAGAPITSETARMATALVLENTQREFGALTESYTGVVSNAGGMGAGPNTGVVGALDPNGGGALGIDQNYGVGDSRIPTIVIPTLRRIFPELIAHDIVGVQPMGGPVGFAFALRFQYGANSAGGLADGVGRPTQGNEMGYNQIESHFTGASGLLNPGSHTTADYFAATNYPAGQPGVGTASSASEYWQAFAGTTNSFGYARGMGADLGDAEWWKIGDDMPMAQFRMEKGVVEAKTRKLAANWSLELAEDMKKMHGTDVDSEMVNVMSYEVKAEIDRQLLGEMVKAAIVGGSAHTSQWSPVSADGRNQLERIGTIYTQVLVKSQQIAILTRRGPATFAVASPTVTALLERLGDFALDTAPVKANNNNIGVSKVGVMRNGGITVYRDTFAGGEYVLLGYKGPTAYDSGIIYCPYIPMQMNRAVGPQSFDPRVGLRTRYGILANLFGSANYYHFMKVDGLIDTALTGDNGGRLFLY